MEKLIINCYTTSEVKYCTTMVIFTWAIVGRLRRIGSRQYRAEADALVILMYLIPACNVTVD